MGGQSVKKLFDRLAGVKEAPKTNKSNSSAYDGTVEFDLCSKSKHLAKQDFSHLYSMCPEWAASIQFFVGGKPNVGISCFDGLVIL